MTELMNKWIKKWGNYLIEKIMNGELKNIKDEWMTEWSWRGRIFARIKEKRRII